MDKVLRPWPAQFSGRASFTVCVNQRAETFVPSCGRSGALDLVPQLQNAFAERGLEVDFQTIACLGLCAKGPNARLAPANSWFHRIRPEDVPEIVDSVERALADRTLAERAKP